LNSFSVDYLIIGGGIFGSFAAKHLAPDSSVALIEKNSSLLTGASRLNQTRLHAGFHYLRAPKTALEANLYHNRFLRDHEFSINKSFNHFYGIARQGSLTSSQGFERFYEWLELDAEKLENNDLLDLNRISDTYLVKEYSYDPYLLARYYFSEIMRLGTKIIFKSEIISANKVGSSWIVEVRDPINGLTFIETKCVINATYSNLSSVSRLFGLTETHVKHEYAELLLAYVPSLEKKAITIMDGPFLSITPYGLTGLHVLSSVIYTHHSSTKDSGQKMDCQIINKVCDVGNFSPCQTCIDKPKSTQKFMLNQLRTFVPSIGDIFVHGQIQTIKSTWNLKDYRDERNTSIMKLASGPDFYAVTSGKVSSIYEIERVFHGDR